MKFHLPIDWILKNSWWIFCQLRVILFHTLCRKSTTLFKWICYNLPSMRWCTVEKKLHIFLVKPKKHKASVQHQLLLDSQVLLSEQHKMGNLSMSMHFRVFSIHIVCIITLTSWNSNIETTIETACLCVLCECRGHTYFLIFLFGFLYMNIAFVR